MWRVCSPAHYIQGYKKNIKVVLQSSSDDVLGREREEESWNIRRLTAWTLGQNTKKGAEEKYPHEYQSALFIERIIQETLQDRHTSISIGDIPVSNLKFTNGIGLMGGTSSELKNLNNILYEKA
ncbi:hypothetical protein DPMN_062638 [Dreissena polymorpha]|uniref:Uncharacterized protein n=1 Tax=Dreissena polymorpha TaxID=45954 RepID=A0A9D4HKC6_DREPO|nr:hypothetical protein DPMN_062638 [Dreissena polymorpha]